MSLQNSFISHPTVVEIFQCGSKWQLIAIPREMPLLWLKKSSSSQNVERSFWGNCCPSSCPQTFPCAPWDIPYMSSIHIRCYPVFELHGCAFSPLQYPQDLWNFATNWIHCFSRVNCNICDAWLHLLLRIFSIGKKGQTQQQPCLLRI